MRTNIIIDDELMSQAMQAGNFATKKEAVEEGLKLLARQVAYQRIRAMRGKLHWSLDGDWTKPDQRVVNLAKPTRARTVKRAVRQRAVA